MQQTKTKSKTQAFTDLLGLPIFNKYIQKIRETFVQQYNSIVGFPDNAIELTVFDSIPPDIQQMLYRNPPRFSHMIKIYAPEKFSHILDRFCRQYSESESKYISNRPLLKRAQTLLIRMKLLWGQIERNHYLQAGLMAKRCQKDNNLSLLSTLAKYYVNDHFCDSPDLDFCIGSGLDIVLTSYSDLQSWDKVFDALESEVEDLERCAKL